jgi:hypothetical protein
MTPAAADQLRQALEAYFADIARQRDPQPPPLIPHFTVLDAWEQEWAAAAPSRLRHYLQQKSYQKALGFVRGEDPEAGSH